MGLVRVIEDPHREVIDPIEAKAEAIGDLRSGRELNVVCAGAQLSERDGNGIVPKQRAIKALGRCGCASGLWEIHPTVTIDLELLAARANVSAPILNAQLRSHRPIQIQDKRAWHVTWHSCAPGVFPD